jgi:hypothetical protein
VTGNCADDRVGRPRTDRRVAILRIGGFVVVFLALHLASWTEKSLDEGMYGLSHSV